jgi:outer membrane protein assembly factor BamB
MHAHHLSRTTRCTILLIVASALITVEARSPGGNWPQFRGPGGSGVVERSGLPLQWSDRDNIAWAKEIPGRGWSSPSIWNDRLYVTTAVSGGTFRPPQTGIFGNDEVDRLMKSEGLSREQATKRVLARDIEPPNETAGVRYLLLALDVATGRVVWEREAHKGPPFRGRHRKNTYASETPVTDGERIYASFGGNVGLFCYEKSGKLLWSKQWPPQPMFQDFGTASSPVVHRGRVYVLHDNEGASFLAAFEAKTGREAWTVKRTHGDGGKSGWATPFVWENDLRTEIVTVGRRHVVSYSLEGRELWRLAGFTQATPSPVSDSGLLYVGSGSQGETNRPMFAVRPGASGDISLRADQASSAYVVWFHPRASAYTSSPLVYRGRMYVVNDNGILTVLDASSGKEIYKARIGGGGNTFSSSPWAYDGKVFFLSEDGDTFVLAAGDEYKELAKNPLAEMSLATPAIGADSVFIRTATRLYRIRQRPASTPRASPR